jgi:tetratricopeptide (TPR) repeat protein
MQTDVGQLIGTVPYMSPEQVMGDPSLLDTRSDVYALGVLTYKLLSGVLPYDLQGKSIADAALSIRNDTPAPLSSVDKVFRGDLETIVAKALEKEKGRRYQSVAELVADIRRYLGNEPILARPPTAAYQLHKLVTRHKLPFAFAAVLFLVVLSGAIVAGWQATRFARQRDDAVVARASADQVVDFLVELFEQSDVHLARDTEPNLRDIMRAGAAKARTELKDQPLVQARLMNVLGSIHNTLDDFDEASVLIEGALEIRRRESGDDHVDVAESLITLSKLRVRQDQHDPAYLLLQEAYDIHRRAYGEFDMRTVGVVEELGNNRFYAGDYESATEHYQRCVEGLSNEHGREHAAVASALSNLGAALVSLRRFDEAEEALHESLEIKRRTDGDQLDTTFTLEHLANIAMNRGDFATAERLQRENVDLARRILHDNHPRLGFMLRNYALTVALSKGPGDAAPIFRESLRIWRALGVDRHSETARTLTMFARNRIRVEAFDEAEEMLIEALRMNRELFGDSNNRVAGTAKQLADLYLQTNRWSDAEPVLLEHYTILSASLDQDHERVVKAISALVELYEGWDRPQDAALWRSKLPDP